MTQSGQLAGAEVFGDGKRPGATPREKPPRDAPHSPLSKASSVQPRDSDGVQNNIYASQPGSRYALWVSGPASWGNDRGTLGYRVAKERRRT